MEDSQLWEWRCSAWDFHIPPTHPDGWQLIEFNDNGSGFLFAALINRIFYERTDMVEEEAARFHGRVPDGLFLILDDAQSLQHGRFRDELVMLRDLFRSRGWQSDLSSPAELDWDGKVLRHGGRAVAFVVTCGCGPTAVSAFFFRVAHRFGRTRST